MKMNPIDETSAGQQQRIRLLLVVLVLIMVVLIGLSSLSTQYYQDSQRILETIAANTPNG